MRVKFFKIPLFFIIKEISRPVAISGWFDQTPVWNRTSRQSQLEEEEKNRSRRKCWIGNITLDCPEKGCWPICQRCSGWMTIMFRTTITDVKRWTVNGMYNANIYLVKWKEGKLTRGNWLKIVQHKKVLQFWGTVNTATTFLGKHFMRNKHNAAFFDILGSLDCEVFCLMGIRGEGWYNKYKWYFLQQQCSPIYSNTNGWDFFHYLGSLSSVKT